MTDIRHVDRPILDMKRWKAFYNAERNSLATALANSGRADVLAFAMRNALNLVEVGCVIDADSKEIRESLVVAAQASVGLFRAAVSKDAVQITLGDRGSLQTKGPVNESFIHPGRWLHAFWINLLASQSLQLRWLCQIPIESLRQSTTKASDDFAAMILALRAYYKGTSDARKRLEQALESARRVKEAYSQLRLTPFVDLLLCLQHSPKSFDDTMYNALLSHKKFWTLSAENKRDPDGFVAVELCALAKLALSKNIALTVQSDYLPSILIHVPV